MPEFKSLLTISEVIPVEREAQKEREAACVEAIKAIHAQGPTLQIAESEASWRANHSGMAITRGPGAIAKFSKHGAVFLGWYREGQRRGIPGRRMPLEIELDRAFDAWAKAVRRSVPPAVTAAILGVRSGQSRRQAALADTIVAGYQQLDREAVPKSRRVKILAKKLDCSVEYVRRVLRQNRRRQALPSDKNTT